MQKRHLITRERQMRVWAVGRRVAARCNGIAPAPGEPYHKLWESLKRQNKACCDALHGLSTFNIRDLDKALSA